MDASLRSRSGPSARRLLLSLAVAGSAVAAPQLTLTPFASGLSSPVGLANAGDSRLFAVEQDGYLRIVRSNGTVEPTPFLDISGPVISGGERGLLGLAFHPDYATNGYFYVNYTADAGGQLRTRISRFSVTANPDVANPASEVILFTVDQPFSNHNAGWIGFGPDGFLYIPLGDGGSGGDPNNNAQNMGRTLGKMLRIDVDSNLGSTASECFGIGTGGYRVPAGNPFVDGPGGNCDEIWSVGLRNPWRCSFDRASGDLWIADVGQGSWEEIDLVGAAGENYGWRCYEGNHPYNTGGCGPMSDYEFPVFEYDHGSGRCSVTGGFVYRGTQFPALQGIYVLTDYCSGDFWMLEDVGGTWVPTMQTDLQAFGYSSFGENVAGELFVTNHSAGTILQVGSDPVPVTLQSFSVE